MEPIQEIKTSGVLPVTGTASGVLKDLLKGKDESLRIAIENATECHRVCEQTIKHCLQKGGVHSEILNIQLLQDAAQISETSADFMIRGSSDHVIICHACAAVCRICAASCDKLVSLDEALKTCVEVCLKCASSCEDMASGPKPS